ncbi:hypothetical protein D0Z00_003318 [Geotrichum galactomycetum]|uniref:Uncharacterized protein n=1 Tax=Geotrichum galactomycetum TaxID=27317 RepID=A0ACB6V1M5_9ASCO|nr:hypothetical protein D0Z00_003318 [Geotrichum candidum]
MSTPTQLRSFWNEFENKPDNEASGSSPTRSPIRSNRSSLQSNAFVQMDLNSSTRLNSPYSSQMSPHRHQRKSSQRESIGSTTKDSPVRPFNKENYSIPINTNESPSNVSKAMPTSDYDRFPLFMSTASEPTAGPEPVVSEPFSAGPDEYQQSTKNSRESDNFTKYLGSKNSRLSDATIIHHPIDWNTTSHTQSGYDDYNDNYPPADTYSQSGYYYDDGHLPVTEEEDTSQIATPVPEDYDSTTPTIDNSLAFTKSVHIPVSNSATRTPVATATPTFPQTPAQSSTEYSHIKIKSEPTEEQPWTPPVNSPYSNSPVRNPANGMYANQGFPSTPKIKTEPVDDSYNAYANVQIKQEPVDDIYSTPRQNSSNYHYQNTPVIKTEPGLETPIFRVLGSGNNTPAFPHHPHFDSPEKEPVSGMKLIDKLQPSISEEPTEENQTSERGEAAESQEVHNEEQARLQETNAVPKAENTQQTISGDSLQAQFQESRQPVSEFQQPNLNIPVESEESQTAQPSLESEAPISDSYGQNEEEDEEEEDEEQKQPKNALPPTIFAPGTKLRARPSMTFRDLNHDDQEEEDEEENEDENEDDIDSPIEEENNISVQSVELPKLELDLFDLNLEATAPVPVHDTWDDLTAKDGSFGRVSIAFKDYESQIFGKPGSFDVPIYNHWATSGIAGGSKTKRPAYLVGVLQVQMMFIPRHSKREELPHTLRDAMSMINQGKEQRETDKRALEERVKAQKEAQEQERRNATKHEGFLSQLGGDCTYWRRRFFKLDGPELTAYSETTRKPRASINLVKAIRVVEDKSTLTEKMVSVGNEKSAAGRRRRKSAFAEQEEAFMFVDSGFRIRFSNGEIIDFYADTMERKEEWVQVLKNVISKALDAKVKVANLKEEINYMPSSKPLPLWVERVLDQESA